MEKQSISASAADNDSIFEVNPVSDKAMTVHNNMFAAGHRLILIYTDSDDSDEDKEKEICEEVEQSEDTVEKVEVNPEKKV